MSMMTMLVEAHSGWRWIVILVSLVVLAKFFYGWLSKSPWGQWDGRLGIAFPIVYDFQLLLGLVLWVMQSRWVGGDAVRSWEHPVTMIVAIVLAHVGWSRAKRIPDATGRFRTAALWYLAAALVMLLGVLRITGAA